MSANPIEQVDERKYMNAGDGFIAISERVQEISPPVETVSR